MKMFSRIKNVFYLFLNVQNISKFICKIALFVFQQCFKCNFVLICSFFLYMYPSCRLPGFQKGCQRNPLDRFTHAVSAVDTEAFQTLIPVILFKSVKLSLIGMRNETFNSTCVKFQVSLSMRTRGVRPSWKQ